MKTTLRQIDRGLRDVAEAYTLLEDYFWGDWEDAFDEKVNRYPLLVTNVPAPVVFGRVTTLQLNLIVVDQLTNSESNLSDVESDTLQILHDLYKVVKYAANWKDLCSVVSASTPIKFKDQSADSVAGWQLTLNIKLIEDLCLESVPLDGYDFGKNINC